MRATQVNRVLGACARSSRHSDDLDTAGAFHSVVSASLISFLRFGSFAIFIRRSRCRFSSQGVRGHSLSSIVPSAFAKRAGRVRCMG